MKSALLIIPLLVAQQGPGVGNPRVTLTTIRVEQDTVWFLGGPHSPRSYAFTRSGSQWLRRDGRPDQPRRPSPLDADYRRDPVEVAPGVRMVRPHVLVTEDGEEHLLPREIPLETKIPLVAAALRHRGGFLEEDVRAHPVSGAVSAWTVHDGVLWLGRAGGWSEGWGGLGGLVGFDLDTRAMTPLWSEHLAAATVSGIAESGGRLWIGTFHPGEYGAYGRTGLLSFDLANGEWRRWTTEDSPLPGDMVWDVASAGDTVWVTTDGGIAVMEVSSGTWDAQYFQPALSGDTVVVELSPVHDPNPAWNAALSLIRTLGIRRVEAFLEAVLALPWERFAGAGEEGWSAREALSHPLMVPFLTEALPRGGDATLIAAGALAGLDGTEWIPVAVSVLDSLTVYEAMEVAVAMGESGSDEGARWLRARLGDPAAASWMSSIVHGLATLRDTAAVPAMLQQLHNDHHRQAVYGALREMDSPAVWKMMALEIEDVPALAGNILGDLDRGYSSLPLEDPEFDAALTRIALRALDDPTQVQKRRAERYLLRVRDASRVETLIEAVADSSLYLRAMTELIRWTGVDTVPATPDPADSAKAAAFWTRWWEQNRATFRPVDSDVGEQAARWWRWPYLRPPDLA